MKILMIFHKRRKETAINEMKHIMKIIFKYTIAFVAFFAVAWACEITSFAQNLKDGVYMEQDGICFRKTVSRHDDDPTMYTIDLEAFVKGAVTYTESADPSDIVLVLDVSGSMNDAISNYYVYNEVSNPSVSAGYGNWNYNNEKSTDYYYKYGDDYYPVRIIRQERSSGLFNTTYWYSLCFGNNPRRYINQAGQVVTEFPQEVYNRETNLVNSSVTLYTRSTAQRTKMDALKDATNSFISEVIKNAKFDKKGNPRTTELDNKIAIVKFASSNAAQISYYNDDSSAYEEEGNGNHTMTYQGALKNYTEVVRGLKSVLTDSTDLKQAVNSLVEGGATAADYGMQLALNIINHIPAERTSNKTVVFFTDGDPTHSSSFDSNVAIAAINTSNSIKSITYGSGENASHPTVFSVGVFDGSASTNTTRFMNRISSNYLDATSLTNGTQSSSDFYKDASGGAADLAAIFKAIASTASQSESSIGEGSAVTVDVVSNSFNLPLNATSDDVTVLVAPCDGIQIIDGKEYYTFGEAKAPSEFDDFSEEGNIVPTVNTDNNTVSTSGFNFSKWFCGPDQTQGPGHFRGYKQVIRFDIKLRDDAVGGPAVATNDESSGIYVNGEQLAKFNRPTVKVPVSIWIQKVGLEGEDSAVFTIYGSPFEGFNAADPESNTWIPITKIIYNEDSAVEITNDQGQTVKVVKKTGLDPDYYYKIKEDAWAFGYQYQDNGIVYTVGDNIKNPFVITNTPKKVVFDEAVHRNIFKKKDQ